MLHGLRKYGMHYKDLCALGMPIVVGQAGQIVLGFADTMMIGHHSTMELGAAAFVNTMFNLMLVAGLGFSYGLTPVVGSLHGKGQARQAGAALKNALVANTLAAVAFMLPLSLLYLCLDRLGQPEELVPLMRPYFATQMLSVPFVMCFNAMKQFFDGIARTRAPMWVMLSGCALNVAGNQLLIFGEWGCPEMGLLGAGVATLLSRAYMMAALMLIFLLDRRCGEYREGFGGEGATKRGVLLLCKTGCPLSLQMGMETASFSLTAIMVGWLGAEALAAHQVMLTISTLCYMMYYGMAAAVAVRVSHFYGRGDGRSLMLTSGAGFHLILLLAVAVSVPILLLRHRLALLFTDDASVVALVAQAIIPLVVYQFGDGMQCNFSNSLRGLSHVRPMMYVAFVAYFVISLPLSYLFGIAMRGGLVGIWYGFPFGLTTAGVLYYILFRRRLRALHFI